MADIMQGANAGMVQRWDGPRFTVKALFGFEVLRKMPWQDFDRNRAIKTSVLGPIYLTHAASAEGRLNFVRAESCARCEGHRARQYSSGLAFETLRRIGKDHPDATLFPAIEVRYFMPRAGR